MISKLTFDPACSQAELDALVEASPTPELMQMGAWAQVKAADWDSFRFGIRSDGKLVGSCLVLLRRLGGRQLASLAYTARGPVFNRENVPAQWYEQTYAYVRRRALAHRALVMHVDPPVERAKGRDLYRALRQAGFAHLGFHTDMREIQPRASMMLNVPGDPAAVVDTLPKKMRQHVRRASKRPVVYKTVGPDDLDDFMHVINEMAQRQDIAMRGRDYFATLLEAFGDRARAVVAYLDAEAVKRDLDRSEKQLLRQIQKLVSKAGDEAVRQREIANCERGVERIAEQRTSLLEYAGGSMIPLACALIVNTGDRSAYLYGGSSNAFRNFLAPYALLYREMQREAEHRGADFVFDFGGVSGETDPDKDPKHGGLYTFKSAWGAEMLEYVGEFTKPVLPLLGHAFTPATAVYKKVRDMRTQWHRRKE